MKYKLILFIGLFCTSLYQTAYSQNYELGLKIVDHENITVVVEDFINDESKIGLTQSRLESRTAVRLREVGLKSNFQSFAFLYIDAIVVGGAYSINIIFNRPMYYYEANQFDKSRSSSIYAGTYRKSITGMHGDNIENIVNALDVLLDDFIADYLRTNDP